MMRTVCGGFLAGALSCLSPPLDAQHPNDGLALGCKMLAEDYSGELWIDQAKRLFHQKRGPKKASLEQCDFGLGSGKLEGATARFHATSQIPIKCRISSRGCRPAWSSCRDSSVGTS